MAKRRNWRRWVRPTLIWIFLTVCGRIVWELIKDAVAGLANEWLAERWEMTDPTIQDAFLFIWLPPLLFAVLIGFGIWGAYRLGTKSGNSQNIPNYAAWVGVDPLELGHAACLWEDIEPRKPLPPGAPTAQLQILRQAIIDRKLNAEIGAIGNAQLAMTRAVAGAAGMRISDDMLSERTLVRRFSLREYADATGAEPPFISGEFQPKPHFKTTDPPAASIDNENPVKPVILAELETTVSPIGDFTPACAIRVTNTGPELDGKCSAQIEDHDLKIYMPDPFVIRTEGQIRGKRTGRFTLSTGQSKLIPILYREPARLNQFRFIGEDGENYSFAGDTAEFVVVIYGPDTPTRLRIHLSVGQDWKVNCEMEYC